VCARAAAVAAGISLCLLCLPAIAVGDSAPQHADIDAPPVEVLTAAPPEPAPAAAEPAPEEPCAAEEPVAPAPESAAPEVCAAQNAGDNQYQDPFAEAEPPRPSDGGGPNNASQPSQTSPSTAAAAPVVPEVSASAAATAQPGLPNTGLGAGWLLAWGTALVAGGLALSRRARASSSAGTRSVT
jgi:LPXTG-motif cell wall-anchored protein